MPARNTKRNRILREFPAGATTPGRCRLFRHAYIRTARVLAAAGNASNGELARHFGVSNSTIANWRKQFPDLNRAIELGLTEANVTIATKAFEAACDGDMTMVRYWLDRRHPEFMPKNRTEITDKVDNFGDTMRRRQITEDELYAKELISDAAAPGNQIAYGPSE
jgi:hypothetical protein